MRSQVQRLIQELLEEEVTEFLGRAKSALRSDSDSDTGYRNGYGRARRLTLSSGTIQLRRPRVRDTEEQFESRLLPLFVNRNQEGGYVNRCVNDIRRRPSQPLIQWRGRLVGVVAAPPGEHRPETLSLRPSRRVGDSTQHELGLVLLSLWKLGEHVYDLVVPAALLCCLRIDVAQSSPDAQVSVSNHQPSGNSSPGA